MPEPHPSSGWIARLKSGLTRTREKLGSQLAHLFSGARRIDAALYEELETILLSADVGVAATQYLLEALQRRARQENLGEAGQLYLALQQALLELLKPMEGALDTAAHRPFIILLAGVNGSGKTTTIGKLAHYYQNRGQSVLLAAGDTFRAAAKEQLEIWAQRNEVNMVAQDRGDPAAVIFDAIQAAKARGVDIVLADTAGRLPTQLHLMEEIKKIKRVVTKAEPTAPHETLLVLDAGTGQNALAQVRAFDDALGLTGLVVTKLDGTAKAGVLAAVARYKPIPIRFIGVGESLDDLRPFEAEEFVQALFE